MPVLNEGERIGRAISSLQDQTAEVSKLIVADGGSTDDTHEVVREKAEEVDFDIELDVIEGAGVRYSSQVSAEKAAEHVISESDNDDGIVLRLEGDSSLDENFVEEAISYLEDEEYTVFGAPVKPHEPSEEHLKKAFFTLMQNADTLPKGRGMAFRAQDFQDVNGYRMEANEDIQASPVDCLEDGILVSKLQEHGKVAFSHDTHVNSTVPSSTATSLERWRLTLTIERKMGITNYFTKIASPVNKVSYTGKQLAGYHGQEPRVSALHANSVISYISRKL